MGGLIEEVLKVQISKTSGCAKGKFLGQELEDGPGNLLNKRVNNSLPKE